VPPCINGPRGVALFGGTKDRPPTCHAHFVVFSLLLPSLSLVNLLKLQQQTKKFFWWDKFVIYLLGRIHF